MTEWFTPKEGKSGHGTKITYKKNGKTLTKLAKGYKSINAIKSDEPEYIHIWKKYNTFEKKKTKIRKNWIELKSERKNLPEYVCGNKLPLTQKPFPDNIKKLKSYYTHDNGGRPFLVFVNGNTNLHIYRIPENVHIDFEDYDKLKKQYYNQLIKSYKTTKIWIGKHTLKDQPDKYWNPKNSKGNSILAQLDNNKYLHIGSNIYEFTTPNNDTIIKYYSMIGNNDVPYPIALGEKYLYQMLDCSYISREAFNQWNMTDSDWEDSAYILYGHDENKQIDKKYKYNKFPNMKIITKRLL